MARKSSGREVEKADVCLQWKDRSRRTGIVSQIPKAMPRCLHANARRVRGAEGGRWRAEETYCVGGQAAASSLFLYWISCTRRRV